MNNLTETEKAYIAGIIDGEGCIYIAKRSPSIDRREITDRFVMGVAVGMTTISVISWLHNITGIGNLYVSKSYNKKHRDKWTWRLSVNDSCMLLNQIMPYLILKREQSSLFLEIASIRSIPKYENGKRVRNNQQRQDEIHMRMKSLNKRGVYGSSISV